MATSFFGGSFFDGEFFSEDTSVSTQAPGAGGGRYKYWTPLPPPLRGKKKRQIDRVIEQEARIQKAIVEYQTSGVDISVLNELGRKLRELQLIILRLGLESELAAQYIEWKRKEEEEDIRFILSQL